MPLASWPFLRNAPDSTAIRCTGSRLERDVLERAGATHVIYLQGMNDIGGGNRAAQITAAKQQIIDRAHARGLQIIGGTLFPPVYDGNQSLKPEFPCDDNVHPNAAGYRAMGEFVDLGLFSSSPK